MCDHVGAVELPLELLLLDDIDPLDEPNPPELLLLDVDVPPEEDEEEPLLELDPEPLLVLLLEPELLPEELDDVEAPDDPAFPELDPPLWLSPCVGPCTPCIGSP
jgi:hypothetical protein